MVARLRFDDDGRAVNRPAETVAQQISWHRAQARHWEGETLNPKAAAWAAYHRQQIAQLLQLEQQPTAADQGVA